MLPVEGPIKGLWQCTIPALVTGGCAIPEGTEVAVSRSNLRYWISRVGFDGFRFDAVACMLFKDHGVGRSFSGDYGEYFGFLIDDHAVTYLTLAHHLLEELLPGQATTIAEDVSGFPGLCRPVSEGGIGFTYRLGLGIPDMWFELLKEHSNLDDNMPAFIGRMLSSLMGRRATLGERTISYVESHDQCIVGGSTTAQWLFAGDIYTCMSKFQTATPRVDMAMAWHKLLRMLTHTIGGEGYLSKLCFLGNPPADLRSDFMGNEFGHPEWVDLPADHNQYSQAHAYRKWSLSEDNSLRYSQLLGFDRALNEREDAVGWLSSLPAEILLHDEEKRHLVYSRNDLLFVFNLHQEASWTDNVPAPSPGVYENKLDTDEGWYGGQGRASRIAVARMSSCETEGNIETHILFDDITIPPRTGILFRKESSS
ncbi:hypothetical protein P7C73_g1828, partial [Tremellales sp. Uapishka_1]